MATYRVQQFHRDDAGRERWIDCRGYPTEAEARAWIAQRAGVLINNLGNADVVGSDGREYRVVTAR